MISSMLFSLFEKRKRRTVLVVRRLVLRRSKARVVYSIGTALKRKKKRPRNENNNNKTKQKKTYAKIMHSVKGK